jgi:hypothetical protein
MPCAEVEPKAQKSTNWEAVFSTWPMRHLLDAKIVELLKAVFSMLSVPRCCKEAQVQGLVSWETVAGQ